MSTVQYAVLPCFATPISQVNVDIDGVVDLFYSKIKPDLDCSFPNVRSHELRHFHNDKNIFKLFPTELHDLEQQLLEGANWVYRKILNHKNDLFITNAWFNECQVGGTQLRHNHVNSVLSGTLYLVTDEHTELVFDSPFNAGETSCLLHDEPDVGPNELGNTYHYSSVTFNPNPGNCLLWPSYLKHGYYNNQTPNRLSLSFNLLPKKFNNMYSIPDDYFSS